MIYKRRPGTRMNVPAQVVGDELERICSENDDRLTPQAVVSHSRPKEAPLHPCFTWDNKKAAELHREEEARRIIRSVEVVHEDVKPGETSIAYVHVNTQENGSSYRPMAVAMSIPEERDYALEEAMRLLRGVRRRFAHLTELSDVFQAIDQAATAVAV